MYSGILQGMHPAGTTYSEIGNARVAWRFTDYETEYQAIRNGAALFDHTTAGITRVTGNAKTLLQDVLGRDIDYLEPERCMMSLVLDADAHPIDLVTVYSFDEYVLLESSWGQADATRAHLRDNAGPDVEITALDGEMGALGVEGPYAWGAVGRVIDPSLTALPYGSVLEIDWHGQQVIFTRNGISGEYGYKLIGTPETLEALWDELSSEATPAGLQALETAMIEVRQPVLHRELSGDRSVVTCGGLWLLDLAKQDFTGRSRLVEMLAATDGTRTLGVAWDDDGDAVSGTAGTGDTVLAGGQPVGTVAWSVYSPGLAKRLGLATVPQDLAASGLPLAVRRAGQTTDAVSLAPPYVVPTSWTIPIL